MSEEPPPLSPLQQLEGLGRDHTRPTPADWDPPPHQPTKRNGCHASVEKSEASLQKGTADTCFVCVGCDGDVVAVISAPR